MPELLRTWRDYRQQILLQNRVKSSLSFLEKFKKQVWICLSCALCIIMNYFMRQGQNILCPYLYCFYNNITQIISKAFCIERFYTLQSHCGDLNWPFFEKFIKISLSEKKKSLEGQIEYKRYKLSNRIVCGSFPR